jgi:hypothetical protein
MTRIIVITLTLLGLAWLSAPAQAHDAWVLWAKVRTDTRWWAVSGHETRAACLEDARD